MKYRTVILTRMIIKHLKKGLLRKKHCFPPLYPILVEAGNVTMLKTIVNGNKPL